ncbi:MAG: DNA-binding protein [Oscillospiraceae bacterium]
MEYISAKDAAKKWCVSSRRVHKYCESARIPNLTRFGRAWMIPKDAEKPSDPRCTKKSGGIIHGNR